MGNIDRVKAFNLLKEISKEQFAQTIILNPHYDNNGYLDGGTVITNGLISHIDPRGEKGEPGWNGEK